MMRELVDDTVPGTRQQQPTFQFGVFELNRRTGELHKHGVKLKLQEQPLRILLLLVEHAGEVVPREDIQKRLWPEHTYVDFDNAINSAIRKLRDALGDSPENPRFVETLARRGYRFIAPVEEARPAALETAPIDTSTTESIVLEEVKGQRQRAQGIAMLAVTAGLIFAGIAAALVLLRLPHSDNTSGTTALRRLTSDAGLTTEPAISRGSLLAYASDRSGEGHLQIWVQQINGGPAIRLTHSEADDRQPSFSPDGTEIVFRSGAGEGALCVVPSLGGPTRFVAPHGRAPRFSPDGKWIAYWVNLEGGARLGITAAKVYVIPSTGGSPREVSTGLAIAGAPVWSPDGKYLLVVGEKKLEAHYQDAPDWWVLPVGGGTPVQTGAYATFAGQDLGLTRLDMMPSPSDWIANKVLFSAQLGDSVDLWQVPIRSRDWQITGKAERLTSTTGEAVSSSATPDGRFIFSHLSRQTHLWTLPIDTDGTAKSAPKQLTESDAAEYWPSVSADGAQLAFTSTRTGKESIWLKDLKTGQESPIPSTGQKQEFPKLSPDGRRLAFTAVEEQEAMEKQKAAIYVLSLDTMLFHKVLDKGDWVWTWSPDCRYLLCQRGALRYVELLDPVSGKMSEFLRNPESPVFQPTSSPDGRWLAFMDMSGLLVAPYHGPKAIPKQEWIRITSGGFFDDKPRWSSNGSALYFTSDRDGSRCLWSQRLDLTTKAPVGAPVPVYHLHSGRRSIGNVGNGLSDIAMARDTIIFPQTELKGNLWMTAPRK